MGADYTWVFTTTAVTCRSLPRLYPQPHQLLGPARGTQTRPSPPARRVAWTLWPSLITRIASATSSGQIRSLITISHTVESATFVALRGAEYTNGTEGHLNVTIPFATRCAPTMATATPTIRPRYLISMTGWPAPGGEQVMFKPPRLDEL